MLLCSKCTINFEQVKHADQNSVINFEFICMFCLQSRMMFIEVTYTLVTEEAERIGVDHVGRVRSTGTSDISQGELDHGLCN